MTDPRNVYYPSGKPLCEYEEDRRTTYHYPEGKEISFIKDGRFTGEMEFWSNEKGIAVTQKTFSRNSKNKGRIRMAFEEGPRYHYFTVNGENTFVYSDAQRSKLIQIDRRDPVNNDILHSTELYPSGKTERVTLYENGLQKLRRSFKDDDWSTEQFRAVYHEGKLDFSHVYGDDGKTIRSLNKEIDASIGELTRTFIHSNGTKDISNYKNNKLTDEALEEDGVITQKIFKNSEMKDLYLEMYTYNRSKQLSSKIRLTSDKWESSYPLPYPLCGNQKDYDRNQQPIQSSDFFYQNGYYIKNGLSLVKGGNSGDVNNGVLVFLKNGREVGEKVYCPVAIDENGELCAYSNIEHKPKDWQPA